MRFLSDDLTEGRFPGTRGDELAIRYLATELETLGYQPGAADAQGKPSWFQPVPLVKHTSEVPARIALHKGTAEVELATGPGVAAEITFRSRGEGDRVSPRDAELVFVGYGITAPEHGWDDYRDVDVKGKIAVILNFNPPWAGNGVRLWSGRWDYKYLEAARHGAIGALIVHTPESAGYPWQVVVTSNGPTMFSLAPEDDPDAHLLFQGWLSHEAAAKVFQLAGKDLAAEELTAKRGGAQGAGGYRGLPLGVTTSFDMPMTHERLESANVIGRWPGTDPRLADQAVLYTAHHDHLGERPVPIAGEHNIYNGALDNASGCAALLEIARALASHPPKRSVVIAFVTAEEQGLLGSLYYSIHPTVPPGKLAVDINLDGVNIYGKTRDVDLLGLGRNAVSPVVEAVARAQGRTVHGDAFADRGYFYRSDDFPLARVGVPGARVGGGPSYVGRPEGWGRAQVEKFERESYHQPSDVYPPSPASWDFSGAIEDAQLQLIVGMRLGNQARLPTWKAGDEFEQARVKALKAAGL